MNPVISLIVGDLAIHTTSYRLFMVMGVLATVGLGFLVATIRGLPRCRVGLLLLAMAVVFPMGARLLDVATKIDLYQEEPGRVLATGLTGFSMYGGLILAVVVGAVGCRLLSLDLPRMADAAMPGLGVGIALMRVGCFLAGCCFGRETDLPWGVTFPAGSDAHLHQLLTSDLVFSGGGPRPVHPTQLYEALAALLAVGLVLGLFRRHVPDGAAFLVCACWYSAFRLVNHLFRVPGAQLTAPELFYPALYATIFSIAAVGLLALNCRKLGMPALKATAAVTQRRFG